MSIVETPKTIFPLAMSLDDAAAFLSISRRALSDLIADEVILAKKSNARTLVDLASLRSYYAGLPKTVSGSIPNAPQSVAEVVTKRRARS